MMILQHMTVEAAVISDGLQVDCLLVKHHIHTAMIALPTWSSDQGTEAQGDCWWHKGHELSS